MILGYHYIKEKIIKRIMVYDLWITQLLDKELKFLIKNKSILEKNDLLKLNYYEGVKSSK